MKNLALKTIATLFLLILLTTLISFATETPDYVVTPDYVDGDLYATLDEDGVYTVYSLTGKFGTDIFEYKDTTSFIQRDGIKKVVMSETITYIGSESFRAYNSDVPVFFSKALREIDGYAFARCSDITIELDEKNPYFNLVDGILYSEDMTKLIYAMPKLTGNFTVPPSVTTVCDGAFVYSNFESITIPDTVTTMMSKAYGGNGEMALSGRAFANALCKNITIGKNVEMLGRCAFFRCPYLETITILGKNTKFEDDFVIDDEGSRIGVVLVPHNSYGETYAQTHYANRWDYINQWQGMPDTYTKAYDLSTDYEFVVSTEKALTDEFLGIAIYSEAGQLLSFKKFESFDNLVLTIPKAENAAYAKIFLWDSLSGVKPIGAVEKLFFKDEN